MQAASGFGDGAVGAVSLLEGDREVGLVRKVVCPPMHPREHPRTSTWLSRMLDFDAPEIA